MDGWMDGRESKKDKKIKSVVVVVAEVKSNHGLRFVVLRYRLCQVLGNSLS